VFHYRFVCRYANFYNVSVRKNADSSADCFKSRLEKALAVSFATRDAKRLPRPWNKTNYKSYALRIVIDNRFSDEVRHTHNCSQHKNHGERRHRLLYFARFVFN